jgi:hypothetical protein
VTINPTEDFNKAINTINALASISSGQIKALPDCMKEQLEAMTAVVLLYCSDGGDFTNAVYKQLTVAYFVGAYSMQSGNFDKFLAEMIGVESEPV